MAYSFIEVAATGTSQTITVPEYISQSHIHVYINGVETTAFSWLSANVILLTAAAGAAIKVVRNTSRNARLVDYMDGGSLSEAILDNDSRQAFFMAQEAMDVLPTGLSGGLVGWDSSGTGLVTIPPASVTNTQVTVAAFSNFRTDTFNGTGAQTKFILSNDPGSVNNCDVAVGGVVRIPGIDFNVVATELTFVNPPPAGTNNVSVRYGAALTAIGAGNYTGYSRTVPITVNYSAAVAINASLSNVFYVTPLTGNTVLSITNPNDAQTINIRFKQDVTGARGVTMPANVFINGAINPATESVTWLILTYVALDSRWEGAWSVSPSSLGQSLFSAPDVATAKALLEISGDGVYAARGANTDISSLNAPFLGAATATTPLSSDNSTKVATTAMVQAAIAGGGGASAKSGANTDITSLASPFIGAATATTQVSTDNSTKVATTAMVQSVLAANPGTGVGVGQTWQATGGRALATTYTNNTGKPIMVAPTVTITGGSDCTFVFTPTVAGVALPAVSAFRFSTGSPVNFIGYPFIVPNGATYSVTCSNPGGATNAIYNWAELR